MKDKKLLLKPIDHESMIAFCDKYSSIVGRRVLFSQKDLGKDGSIELKPIYASVLLRGNILSVILLPRVFFFYIIKPLRNKCREIPVLPSLHFAFGVGHRCVCERPLGTGKRPPQIEGF